MSDRINGGLRGPIKRKDRQAAWETEVLEHPWLPNLAHLGVKSRVFAVAGKGKMNYKRKGCSGRLIHVDQPVDNTYWLWCNTDCRIHHQCDRRVTLIWEIPLIERDFFRFLVMDFMEDVAKTGRLEFDGGTKFLVGEGVYGNRFLNLFRLRVEEPDPTAPIQARQITRRGIIGFYVVRVRQRSDHIEVRYDGVGVDRQRDMAWCGCSDTDEFPVTGG